MANILLVDDDKIVLKLVEASLQAAGHSVTTAGDGMEALDLLKRELFEMLITDANMPVVSGFNLVSTIKKLPEFQELPVIFITGRREKVDVERALKAGVDDYIVKPIDQDIFRAKVESLLENRRGTSSFKETPIDAKASWTTEFQIIGLSEQGIAIMFQGILPTNFKMQIQTELFEDIGIRNPTLRVVSCEPAPEDRKKSIIKMNFIGLTEAEHQAIRVWTMSKRTQKAS